MYLLQKKHFVVMLAPAILLVTTGYAASGTQKQQPAQATTSTSGPPASATYVGSDTCKTCHEDVHKAFETNPHYQLIKESGKTGAGLAEGKEFHGCESCHGPGSAHVEAGGDPTKIFRFEKASPEQVSLRCLQCHEGGHEQSNFMRSMHLKNGVSCISCHSVHAAKVKSSLLAEAQPMLCYSCHTEEKAEFARPFHHRVNEGLVQCSDCHNVHGGFLPRQLRTDVTQNQVCFKCHTEKRGPFVYEHVPVKTEGCTSCHMPHGSTSPRLLRVSNVNLLCLQCHTQALSNVPSANPLGPAHNQATKFQACTSCHMAIHGSNFSEVFFQP